MFASDYRSAREVAHALDEPRRVSRAAAQGNGRCATGSGSEANAFEKLAERQIPAPRKTRLRAAEKRATEKDQLQAGWRAWHEERREALLNPHGRAARELLRLLEALTLDDGDALIEAVRCGPWCKADPGTRAEVLSLIDRALIELRERHGLVPIDDALPGEEPNVFLVLRELLA